MAQSDYLGISDGVEPGASKGERLPALLHAMNVVVGLNFLLAILSDGVGLWLSFSFYFAFSIVIDEVLGPWRAESSGENESSAQNRYEVIMFLVVAIVVVTFVAFLVVMQTTAFLSLDWFLRVFTLGLALGILGVPIAHELGHRRRPLHRRTAAALMALMWQPQFEIAHNMSHHRWVATTNDSATALYNENVYSFILRSFFCGWADALKLERRRVRHLSFWKRLANHQVFRRTAFYGLFTGFLLLLVPASVVAGWIVACVFAAALVEIFNYISHYGMLRRFRDGEYERVGLQHVWSSDYLTTRVSMLELPYHADHHVHARKRYYNLRNYGGSPQLPASYQALYLLSLVPPLWFAVMNPLVRAHLKDIGLTEEERNIPASSDEVRLFGLAEGEEP